MFQNHCTHYLEIHEQFSSTRNQRWKSNFETPSWTLLFLSSFIFVTKVIVQARNIPSFQRNNTRHGDIFQGIGMILCVNRKGDYSKAKWSPFNLCLESLHCLINCSVKAIHLLVSLGISRFHSVLKTVGAVHKFNSSIRRLDMRQHVWRHLPVSESRLSFYAHRLTKTNLGYQFI